MAEEFEIRMRVVGDTAGASQTVAALRNVTTAAREAGAATGPGAGGSSVIDGLTGGISGKLIAFAAATATVGALTGVLHESMAAAAECEAAQLKLNSALANTGQLSAEVSDSIQDLTQVQEETTGIVAEVWQEAIAKIIQFRAATAEEIPAVIPILEGLAARMGGDVAGAADLFARSMAGNTRGLVQLGVHLKEGADKTEIMAALTAAAATGQGLLAAKAETTAGKILAAKNRIAEFAESLGLAITHSRAFSGALDLASVVLDYWSAKLPKAKDETLKLAAAMGKAAPPIEEVAKALTKQSSAADDTIKRLGQLRSSADLAAGAMKELAAAQRDLETARIDAKVANHELSPEEGAKAKAHVAGKFELQQIQAQQREAGARRAKTESALRALDAQERAAKTAPPPADDAERDERAAEAEKRGGDRLSLQQELAAMKIKIQALEKTEQASRIGTGAAVKTAENVIADKAAKAGEPRRRLDEEVREGLGAIDGKKLRSPEATAALKKAHDAASNATRLQDDSDLVATLHSIANLLDKSGNKKDPEIAAIKAQLAAIESKIGRGAK